MSGRHGPRSKNGCSTCRRRKVKCGEEHPVCRRCLALRLTCEWGVPVKRDGSNPRVRYLQPARPRWQETPTATTTPSSSDVPIAPPARSPFYSDSNTALWHPQSPENLSPTFSGALSPTSWSPGPVVYPASVPLYPSLSETEIACSNSLVLAQHDQRYFQYFPSSSVVFYYMKSWPWSSFSYLYQGPAVSSKVIMRMILAVSASDMHRNALVVRSPGRPTAEDHARYHYGLAVKEFRQLLEAPRGPISPTELETIFATMFLMVTYEWQFGQSVRDLQLHLRGVRSLLASHPELFQVKDVDKVLMSMEAEEGDESTPRVSFIPEQLLLWILYIDASCPPVDTSQSLYDYVLKSDNPALHPDRLYRCARLWGRCFWGKQYPDQEVSDDMENYRALQLLHTDMGLRYKTWKALSDDPNQTRARADSLRLELMTIREQFSDLFLTAKFAGAASTRRTLNTINMAVSTFYAQILFHRRLLYPPGPPSNFHRLAVTNIIEIMHKQYASDPRLMRRLHWPLLMAVIETQDAVHREWLRERLTELRGFHSEALWASDIADEVLARQDASQGRYADLAELLRERMSR